MAAVYELSTVKPHLPPRRRYTLAELELYSAGYYQALAMALRVMQLAFRRWESRTMRDQQPTVLTPKHQTPNPHAAPAERQDQYAAFVFRFFVVAAVIVSIEFLVLLAAVIVRVLR